MNNIESCIKSGKLSIGAASIYVEKIIDDIDNNYIS